MTEKQDIRWQQRYSNYHNILAVLNRNLAESHPEDFDELEQIGLTKSFELSFELSWKLIKDYLESQGIEIGLISPKNVLRIAASSGLLELVGVDGDTLLAAHKTRNELTHMYDEEAFQAALFTVKAEYLAQLNKIDNYFNLLVTSDG